MFDDLYWLIGFVAAAGLLAIAVSTTVQYRRLSHIKGPALSGVSNWWQVRSLLGGAMHLDLYQVSRRYGYTIARVGPNDLMTSDPDLVKRMLNTRTTYTRSSWYAGMRMDPDKDNVESTRDDTLHTKLRSQMAGGYSGKEVQDMEGTIDENILGLVHLIEGYIARGKLIDMGRKLQFLTLDIITHLAFGEAFGDMASDSDVHQYIASTEHAFKPGMIITILPWVARLSTLPLLKSLLPSETDETGLGKIMGIAKSVTASRFGPNKVTQRDMLGSFIAKGLSQSQAETEILMQLFAGSETTATAIRATLLYILTSPRVHNRLLAEILEHHHNNKPTSPSSSSPKPSPTTKIIPDASARQLPYLQATIKEGLRIFPPVVGLMSKEVPPGGDTFKGVYLPEGTRVGFGALGTMRREDIWGQDSGEFRPERWLLLEEGLGDEGEEKEGEEEKREKLRRMEGTLELAFGYGKWKCLGKDVAMMELNKAFYELLLRFDMSVVDPTNPWESKMFGIFIQSEFWIRAHKRDARILSY